MAGAASPAPSVVPGVEAPPGPWGLSAGSAGDGQSSSLWRGPHRAVSLPLELMCLERGLVLTLPAPEQVASLGCGAASQATRSELVLCRQHSLETALRGRRGEVRGRG